MLLHTAVSVSVSVVDVAFTVSDVFDSLVFQAGDAGAAAVDGVLGRFLKVVVDICSTT